MKDKLFNIMDKFFDTFYLSDKNSLSILTDFANHVAKLFGIEDNINVKFRRNKSLLIQGSSNIEEKLISFNLNLFECLEKYKIDSNSNNFNDFVARFKTNYESTENHDEIDDALYYTITNRPKEYLSKIGSFKTYKYTICLTVLHEIQHFVQAKQCDDFNNFLKKFEEIENRSKLFFEAKLNPSEIDAIHTSVSHLNKYLISRGVLFEATQTITNSIPFKKEDNAEELSKKIVNIVTDLESEIAEKIRQTLKIQISELISLL